MNSLNIPNPIVLKQDWAFLPEAREIVPAGTVGLPLGKRVNYHMLCGKSLGDYGVSPVYDQILVRRDAAFEETTWDDPRVVEAARRWEVDLSAYKVVHVREVPRDEAPESDLPER